jgi:microcystin-dependent protein
MFQQHSRRLLSTPENPAPDNYVYRRVRIPDSLQWVILVNGVLSLLLDEKSYEPTPDGVSVEETTAVFREMWLDYSESNGYSMLGVVVFHARSTLPPNMLRCDGAEYDRTDYPELYAVLDDEFIVDADHFVTPLIEGVFPIGATSALNGDYPINASGGAATVTLAETEMPTHDHDLNDPGHNHTQNAHGHTVTDPGHNHTQNGHTHDMRHTHTFFGRTNGLVPGTSNRTAMADASGANSTPSTQTQSANDTGTCHLTGRFPTRSLRNNQCQVTLKKMQAGCYLSKSQIMN